MPKDHGQALATRDVSDRPISDIAPEVPASKDEPALIAGPPPLEEDIRERAYRRYLDRGREEGHAEEDWLAAEQELQGRGA